MAKLREVERWVAINSIAIRIFNLLLPGAGGLYGNRILSGALLIFSWALAICALVLPPFQVSDWHRLSYFDLSILFGVELLALLAIYIVALLQSLRH